MKFKNTTIPALFATAVLISCNNDDNTPKEELLPIDVQNNVDDEAIKKYLSNHYFNEQGKVTKFDDNDASDDNETPLSALAQYHELGYYTVKTADYDDTGKKVTDVNQDAILLQYDMFTFRGLTNDDRDSSYYSTPARYSSTINAKGYPTWDPDFYHKSLTNIEIENKVERAWYELEGFQEGIKEFNAADKEIIALPPVDFQGLVIIPSRLAFGRDRNALGFSNDLSVVINFELYQVNNRK